MPRQPTAQRTEVAHRAIAVRLAAEIAQGRPPVGGLLPPEPALQARFGASRYAVRSAVAWLRAQGLVSPQRGRGTVVLARRPETAYVQTLGTIDEQLGLTRELTQTLLDSNELVADAGLARVLDGAQGQHWICARVLRRRDADSPPVGLVRLYLRPELGGVIGRIGRHRGPIFQLFEAAYGVRIVRIDQRVEAVALTAADARVLRIASGAPALSVVRHFVDASQRIQQVSVGLYPGGRFAQTTRLWVGDR
jgi:DNA-binding GntR family transcriptional regulator